jgi:hypothetical protein
MDRRLPFAVEFVSTTLRDQVLLLGRHQVRTVEREKWLAFLDKVPDVIARLSVLIVVGWATRRAKRIQETTVRLVDRGAALNSLDVLEWHLRVSQSKT